jgi:hypothetical protein
MCNCQQQDRNERKPNQNERKVVNDKFDELAKTMAQSATRRGALKKFGLGLAGLALASLGLANNAEAAGGCKDSGKRCSHDSDCCSGFCVPSDNHKGAPHGFCS